MRFGVNIEWKYHGWLSSRIEGDAVKHDGVRRLTLMFFRGCHRCFYPELAVPEPRRALGRGKIWPMAHDTHPISQETRT